MSDLDIIEYCRQELRDAPLGSPRIAVAKATLDLIEQRDFYRSHLQHERRTRTATPAHGTKAVQA